MANAAGDLDVKMKRIRVFADDMEIVFPPKSGSMDGSGADDNGADGDGDQGNPGGSNP
jgi:hypothetical protein